MIQMTRQHKKVKMGRGKCMCWSMTSHSLCPILLHAVSCELFTLCSVFLRCHSVHLYRKVLLRCASVRATSSRCCQGPLPSIRALDIMETNDRRNKSFLDVEKSTLYSRICKEKKKRRENKKYISKVRQTHTQSVSRNMIKSI